MVRESSVNENNVEDIEDLLNNIDIQSMERLNSEKLIKTLPKVQTIRNVDYGKGEFSNGPGMGKIYIKTWGCTHNSSDSEYMAGMLAAYGFTLVEDKIDADLWLLNSCTVKNPAEDHFRNEINAAKSNGKQLVLAGCVPQGAPKSDLIEGFSIIGVQQIDRIVEVVQETLNGNTVRLLGVRKENGKKSGGAPLNLPKIRRNKLVEIIAINTGCLNQCTYCKTKHARGNLGSYPVDEIVQRAQQAFSEGVVEIWLTSEDTGTYGRDIGTNLPTLMWQLISVVPNGCRLRLGMTNPPYILEHAEEIAKILNHPAVYKFLHIPIQSGSDTVLFEMKREYSRNDFETLVDFLKKKVPGLTIATDIICGYPTETDEDFLETLSICEKYKFPSLFINQFYPRPGTPASLLPQLDKKIVKSRTKTLSDYFRSYNPYDNRVGRKYHVLLTDKMVDKKMYVGHNEFYEQILIPFDQLTTDQCPLGKIITVKIVKSTKFSMIAKPIHSEFNLFYLAFFLLLITILLRLLLLFYKSVGF